MCTDTHTICIHTTKIHENSKKKIAASCNLDLDTHVCSGPVWVQVMNSDYTVRVIRKGTHHLPISLRTVRFGGWGVAETKRPWLLTACLCRFVPRIPEMCLPQVSPPFPPKAWSIWRNWSPKTLGLSRSSLCPWVSSTSRGLTSLTQATAVLLKTRRKSGGK